MHRASFLFAMMALLWLAAAACGEQQVKLQSGATLVGDISVQGSDLVVDVDGAKIRVPFQDVVMVTPVGSDAPNDAERLLLKAIEAQVLADGEKSEFGLFAEAYRLAPDNPRVAFWYARSLVSAGYGKGASEVFEPRRQAIVAAYPGIADQLAKQIEERVALEKLPAALVKRLDEIARVAEHAGTIQSEMTAYAAYFRLVDQQDQPIERSAFRVNCSGENEELESFADGYYLYTFFRRDRFGNNPCRLQVARPGLVGKVFEFQGSSHGAENVGTLRVERMNDEDRRPVAVKVVDPQGNPLPGATVTFHPVNQMGNQGEPPQATTAAGGEAKAVLFPDKYNCQVSLKGYSPTAEMVSVAPDAETPAVVEVKLYRAITATIKVVWRAKMGVNPGMPQFGNDSVTTGEFEQHTGRDGGGFQGGPFGPSWVRLVQTNDKMQLQFYEQPMGFPQPAESSWVGRLKDVAEDSNEDKLDAKAVAELFDVLALAELDAIADEFKVRRTKFGGMPGPGGPTSVPLDTDDIYIGKINSRDPQTGRPATIAFKILATELYRP